MKNRRARDIVREIEEEIGNIVLNFVELYNSGANLEKLKDYLGFMLCPKYYDETIIKASDKEQLLLYVLSDFITRYRSFLLRNLGAKSISEA